MRMRGKPAHAALAAALSWHVIALRAQPSRIVAPIDDSEVSGKDIELSGMLGSFLGGDSINSRSDDDKTLILAVRR